MRRVRCSVVIGRVTSLTSRVGQRIVVVDVACGAGDGHVRTRQRESRSRVIENDTSPTRGAVAGCASGGEPGRRVRWRIRSVVVWLVAPVTIRWRRRETPVQVARRAWHGQMKTRERESGLAMVKRRGLPRGGGMASRASCGDPGGDVGRIRGAGEILCMARIAIRRRGGVVAVDVAQRASDGDVRPGKRESRFAVVKCRRLPGGGVMADGTGGWNSRRGVWRIVCAVKILRMA